MNAAQNAYATFGKTKSAVKTTRQVEYQAFAHVTRMLTDVATMNSFPALAEALYLNQKLWTTLASNVADETNGLPKTLRAQIYALAAFTRDHTRKVQKGEADAAPLVEINTAIMKGLRDSQGGT